MDIKAEKLDLIQWLSGLTDESIIAKIIAIKKEKLYAIEEISTDEVREIQEGLDQANKGDFISHDEVMKNPRKWG